jgi:iron complex transport system substrate-binding protein
MNREEMKKYWVVAFCIMVCLLALASRCMAARTLTVTDMAGRRVTVPFDPERIVCLGPGALRLIVYLDAVSKTAGVEDMEKREAGARPYRLAHPELADLPRCGPGGPAGINKKPDLEAVLSVDPQVIFATCMDASLADEVQRTLRIPLVVLSYGASSNFDETVFDALHLAGAILHRERRAGEVVAYIEDLRRDMPVRPFMWAVSDIAAPTASRARSNATYRLTGSVPIMSRSVWRPVSAAMSPWARRRF